MKNQSNFKTRPSSSLFQIARGSGATLRWMYFFLRKSAHHSEDPKKRYMVSLRKALRPHLYLLGRTWRNKMRLPELNHEVLGGLSILGCFCNQGKDQMLTTSWVKQKRRKEEAEGTRDHRSQVFSVLTRTKRLSRQRSTYPELFTRHRWKPDKHSAN